MRRAIMLTAAAVYTGPALAQDGPPAAEAPLTIEIGPGVVAAPRYPGSGALRVLPIPAFSIRYKETVFASVQDGFGATLIKTGGFEIGPLLRPDFGRRARDARRYLPGLGKVGFAPELGGFVTYALGRTVSARVEGRQAIGGHRGFVAEASLRYARPVGTTFVAIGPRVRFTDARYNRAYFGVASNQAGPLRPFRPGAGIGQVGLGGVVAQPVGRRLTLALFGDYGRLIGDDARSPVVTDGRGSRDQLTAGASLAFRFAVGHPAAHQ